MGDSGGWWVNGGGEEASPKGEEGEWKAEWAGERGWGVGKRESELERERERGKEKDMWNSLPLEFLTLERGSFSL